jgi:hypothetical protein
MAGIASVGAVVLAGAFLAPAMSQASPVRASSASPTPAEQYAMKIRAQLGFESDLPYVQSLESQPGLNDTDIGTPVTAAELAELVARNALGDHVKAVEDALSALPSFGGVWFKQAGDGAIEVNLTSPPTAAVTQLVNSVLPANSAVDFIQVPLSYSQLNSLYQSIIATPLPENDINSIAIDTTDDTVTVGVAAQADISAIYAKYGQTGLTVTVTQPSTSN